MRSSERTILFALAIVAIAALFWFLVLSPKRAELSDAKAEVETLQGEIAVSQSIVESGNQAKENFSADYATLVELGKAVPPSADTPNLLIQMEQLSEDAKVDFRSITLSSASGAVAPEGTEEEGVTTPAPTAVPATESAVAGAPLGSTAGPAGLPVMPYALLYRGGFFTIADFFKQIDSMVQVSDDGTVDVRGRLLTIDGFVLSEDVAAGFPRLAVNVAVTSYLTPADQGLFAGATPQGPLSTMAGGG